MKIFLYLVLSGLMLGVCNQVSAGWYTGNAGDILSAEFILTARDISDRLGRVRVSPTVVLPSVDRLRGAIAATLVHSEDHVINNGFEVDAANLFPNKNEIIVNRARWKELRRAPQTRERFLLVLHEYLWIMGLHDEGFRVSAPVIDLLNIGNYSPNVFWSPINPVNYVSIVAEDATKCVFDAVQFKTDVTTENMQVVGQGDCADLAGKAIEIVKTSSVIPASAGVRGLFQRYRILLRNDSGQLVGDVTFEPQWGRCLTQDQESCRSSGKVIMMGLSFEFGYLSLLGEGDLK